LYVYVLTTTKTRHLKQHKKPKKHKIMFFNFCKNTTNIFFTSMVKNASLNPASVLATWRHSNGLSLQGTQMWRTNYVEIYRNRRNCLRCKSDSV